MTQTITPAAPTPGSAEYEAAMEAKGAALDTPAESELPQGADRPAWLPEKFKSPEDMAKAYSELEKKQSQPKADEAKPEATPDEAKAAVAGAGLDFDDFSSEFTNTGALSDASYEKLAKSGIPREMVDSYIAGQQAQAGQLRTEVVGAVGGDEAYVDMIGWAAKTLPAHEVDAYNRVMDSGDLNMIKLAVSGLQAKYGNSNPKEPSLLTGATGRAGDSAFESTEQLVAAMRDPRYKTDPAYRKSIDRRLDSSNIF